MAGRKSELLGSGTGPRATADRTAPRNLSLEAEIASAIARRRLVELRYRDELVSRIVAPHVLFHSTKDKVCLSGQQIEVPGEPWTGYEPRTFEVGLVADLRITDETFTPDPRFARSDERYRNGIIASV
jgi:hypothetical protein